MKKPFGSKADKRLLRLFKKLNAKADEFVGTPLQQELRDLVEITKDKALLRKLTEDTCELAALNPTKAVGHRLEVYETAYELAKEIEERVLDQLRHQLDTLLKL